MFKLLKYLFYIITILIIGASVYIATLPSKFEYTYNITLDKISKKQLKSKLIEFESWKKWAIDDNTLFKIKKHKDPLQSSLESSLTNKQEFKLENEQISDSIIVQKLYTAKQVNIQTLTWNLGKGRYVKAVELKLNEELSFSDKLLEILNRENFRRTWLISLNERLSNLKQTKPIVKSTDYTLSKVKENTFGPLHYIYITGSGNISHLEEQTEEHIIKLEEFLDSKDLNSIGKPFTIYNNEPINGNVIFSTALPISKSININLSNSIRYAFLDTINVYEQEVIGNPENIELLWKKMAQTQEVTFTEMTKNRFVQYISPLNALDNNISKKQKLVWEKQIVLEKIEKDTIAIDSIIRVPKTLKSEPI